MALSTVVSLVSVTIVTMLVVMVNLARGVPSLEDTPLDPIMAVNGDEILLECVVRHIDNYTVLWRRIVPGENRSEVLTAGSVRVIPDVRFSVLHQTGHDTWVLSINPTQVTDSGRYICEVNTSPRLQIYRLVTVMENMASDVPFSLDHNYTSCCVRSGIPPVCQDFCSLRSVVMGGHPNPWQCMDYLPTITRCLTDGRNHLPCCIRQNIPKVCRSVCVGDYGLSTVLQHYSCMEHTTPTLACIAEGIELLPGPPVKLVVEPVSATELKINWSPPHQSVALTQYQINVTRLHELSNLEPWDSSMHSDEKASSVTSNAENTTDAAQLSQSFLVNGNKTSFSISNLEPTTMYEIQMASLNEHGSSLPTYALRVLTLAPQNISEPIVDESQPSLPNITSCCEQNGVPVGRCLRSLCDPSRAEETRLSDIMVCAPWANITFECMAGGVDHSQCCYQRGLPSICMDFCRGNVTQLDFRHFVCLEHMSVYGNCLLEHYGVLPGPPQDLLVTVIRSHWAVLQWTPPNILANTVTGYILFWRDVMADDFSEYQIISNVKSPYLFDNLKPGTRYEVLVVARNKHGTSRESVHAVFTTAPRQSLDEVEMEHHSSYNETACCVTAGLRDNCLSLCSYQMKMADLQLRGALCADQLEILIRCGAGGRDHGPCCQRRGVRWDCLPLCSGVLEMTPHAVVNTCIGDVGKIVQCMVDGTDTLPGIPEDLQTTFVNSSIIKLQWNPSNGSGEALGYEVRYHMTVAKVPPHPLDYSESLNVTKNEAVIQGLNPNSYYSIYVVALNEHGYSLPSLVMIVHTLDNNGEEMEISGSLSPPHSLEVIHQTMDSVTITWRSPLHLPVDASLVYMIYYQPANNSIELEKSLNTAVTTFNTIMLSNLTINTQYAVAVKARSSKQESQLSEIVLAWTDPAIPAFLNPPVIIPPEPVIEGSNITLLCVATGMPVPNVSLYLNGKLVVEQQQNHVALVLPHVHRNISKVDCFADNGYGQGAQSSLNIQVNFHPSIHSESAIIMAEEEVSTQLLCIVTGHPEPRVLWYQDRDLRVPIRRGPNLDLLLIPHNEEKYTYVASLVIPNVTKADEGQYFCHAENQYGKAVLNLTVQIVQKLYANTTACCEEKGVSPECRDACSFDVDVGIALNKPRCFRELDKLMYCAADGSDHRKCCRDHGVSRSCLKWCQGRPIVNTHLCILHSVKKIVDCFEEGKNILPGPPLNIRADQLSSNAIEIHWDSPQKNPDAVQWYRVFYRPVGSRSMTRNQTRNGWLTLKGLDPDTTYEVVVKAGNHYGVSLHSEPLVITLHGPGMTTRVIQDNTMAGTKIAIGVVVGSLLLVIAGAVAIFMYFRLRGKPAPGTSVSFENPTYMKDSLSMQNSPGGDKSSSTDNEQKPLSQQHNPALLHQDSRLPNGHT